MFVLGHRDLLVAIEEQRCCVATGDEKADIRRGREKRGGL
jgi:hypothetical protein